MTDQTLRLDDLQVENFESIIEPLHLDLYRMGPGLHFFCGTNQYEPTLESNGAGKSAIFNSLLWCWYGKAFGRNGAILHSTDVKPTRGRTGPTIVQTRLGKDWIIRRTDPNRVTWNDKLIDQDELERRLPSFALATNSIFLGQERPLFLDLTPSGKMDLFIDALELDRWSVRSDNAKKAATDLDKEIDDLDRDIERMVAERDTSDNLLVDLTKQSQVWQKERQGKDTVDQKALDVESKKLDKLQRTYDGADLKLDNAETELRALRTTRTQCEIKLRDAKLEQLGAGMILNKLIEEQRDKARLRDELGRSKQCPLCGQDATGSKLAKHRAHIEDEITALKAKIAEGIPRKILSAVHTATKQMAQTIHDIERFDKMVDEARDAKDTVSPDLEACKARIEELRKRLALRNSERNPYHDQMQNLRRQIAKLRTAIRAGDDKLAALRERHARTAYWVTGFKDVRLFIIEDVLQELGLAANSMLEEFGLIGWVIHFQVERETKSGSMQRGLNVLIESPRNRSPVRFETWSGGEAQRLRLIGSLALSETLLNHAGIDPSFEILDEPTRGLSRGGTRDLVEILAHRAKQLQRCVLFADHLALESKHFSSTIHIIKDKKGTRLGT